jgi:hypothetical protein
MTKNRFITRCVVAIIRSAFHIARFSLALALLRSNIDSSGVPVSTTDLSSTTPAPDVDADMITSPQMGSNPLIEQARDVDADMIASSQVGSNTLEMEHPMSTYTISGSCAMSPRMIRWACPR